jgi:hypothetical protein
MVHEQTARISAILNLEQKLRQLSQELGVYQFVIPLNNTKTTIETSVVGVTELPKAEYSFELGRMRHFPNVEYRPTRLVIVDNASELLEEVSHKALSLEEKLTCNFDWHLTQTSTQSVFLSIGFQIGVCWPWHSDNTTHKFHKLLVGEANFLYLGKKIPLVNQTLQKFDTSKKHTLEQISPIRVDLIFDSKENIIL